MRLRLQLVAGSASGVSVLLDADNGASLDDLGAELARAGLVPATSMPLRWAVDGVPLPGTAALGNPPLLQGSRVHLEPSPTGPSSAVRPGPVPTSLRTGLIGLHVSAGPDSGAVHELAPGRHVLGRGAEASVRIHDDALSRCHAVLEIAGHAVTVADAGSTNGTRVAGAAVGLEPVVLEPGAQLRVGESTLVLRTPELPPAAVRPDREGHLLVSRAPRVAQWQPGPPVAFPEPPPESTPTRLPVVGLVLPVVVSVILALVMQSPTMLWFGLMSPALLLGTWLSDRRAGRRSTRAERARHTEQVCRARAALDDALAQEVAARRSDDPDLAWHAAVAKHRLSRLWDRTGRPGLLVRVGTGSTAASVSVSGPAPSPRVADVPILVDLAGCTGLAGPRDQVLAAARAILGMLAVRHSPAELAIVVDPAASQPDWHWVWRLPQALAGWPQHPDPAAATAALTEAAGGRRVLVVTESAALVEPTDRVHVLAVATTPARLPTQTTTLLDLTTARPTLEGPNTAVGDLVVDRAPAHWAERLADWLHPLRDLAGQRAGSGVPDRVGLLELLGLPTRAGRPDLSAHWRAQPRTTRFPVGADATGVLWLDLVRDGPHALVGGTTGSGKSELLISLVAALAAGNRPDELSFVLVDYKGGAAFGNCRDLPHVVGLVTDLDHHLTERALVSLDAELKRRERVLHQHGVADLAAYQQRWHEGVERLGRLVIVVDEFRSLAEELPDFVDGLVRVASVGRSLGVHLVVATQRPGGVVTADMRANIGLRVGLRVRDTIDSLDVLDSDVAARIAEHTPGRAFVHSAATTVTEVQTPLATGAARLGDTPTVTLRAVGGVPLPETHTAGTRTELHLIVDAARNAMHDLGIDQPASPWLPPLPVSLTLDELATAPPGADDGGVVLGLCDEPAAQRRTPWRWDPTTEGNLGIVGGPRSGRTTALVCLVAALARRYQPTDLHVYAVHTGALEGVERLACVGAAVPASDPPRLARLLTLLSQSPQAPAHRVLLVDDWERVLDTLDRARATSLTDQLLALARRGADARLTLAVTGGRGLLSGQVAGALTRRLLLLPADQIDLTLAGVPHSAVPIAAGPGRALDGVEHTEVQVAAPVDNPTPGRRAAYLQQLAAAGAARPPAHRGGPPLVPDLPQHQSRADLPSPRPALCLGTDGSAAVGFDPRQGDRRLAVLGARGSGRTTTLGTLAAELLDTGRPVAVLRGAINSQWPHGATVFTLEEVEELVSLRRRHPALALVVDDAARLVGTPMEPVVAELARCLDEDDGVLVVAATPAQVVESFRSPLAEVAGAGTGVLLGALGYGEESVLGLRRALPTEDLPGRGLLVRRGRAVPVQVAVVDPLDLA